MKSNLIGGFLLFLVGVIGTYVYISMFRYNPDKTEIKTEQNICQKHHIPISQCAFCDRSLVEKLGFCHGHGVPEAFCYQCNPLLINAFKAEGDWCAGHSVPESQCKLCKGGDIPVGEKLCERHKVPVKHCPFCDPKLIEAYGQCNAHGVPEALCYQCNKVLISAFKLEGDWCATHNTPESQCKLCKK